MPHSALRVTCKTPDATRIRRQGGYCWFDIWLLLLIFFTTGAAQGVKGLWEELRPFGKRLAALAGRKRLASPSSVSRALDAAENELVRPVAGKLLLEVTECEKVLQHPASQTYDTLGRAWHVFDLDPTVTTLRQRALPEDEALPEPKRRACDTGAPGYSGRKRGDLQFRRVTVQHAGSVILAILAEQDWPSLLARRPGWSWDATRNELHCPDGRTLTLATVRAREHAPGRTGVIFLRPAGGCDDCQVRPGCFDSEHAGTPKHAEFSLPTSVASRLRERLARVRGQGHAATAPMADTSGPRALHDSLFLPAEAGKVYTACFHMASVRIEVELPPPEQPRPRLVATDVADKQRRRKTWADNLARYALPKGAQVDASFEGPPALHRVLGQQGQQLGATG